ncbi:hypothetical protein CDV31_001861 [Fusarium ambrosium]|uniref:N-acetyltransferase domain-containing protein n=1 Tax=Fusarium ambrosium TaxID=131363 RepID=A0A428UXZ5_9HYPO|nr:hypothetical protein CDV31_001861 [Fusarium ambrosium]
MSPATRQDQLLLVPWDPESPEHIARLIEQRVQCGWNMELVEKKWRGKQRSGHKCIYWITLSPEDAGTQESLQLHFDKFPAEKAPLVDTATTIRAKPRTPTQESIHPVGHISLDDENVEAAHLGLDFPEKGVFWIKTFYVSKALQSKGIGRAAMDIAEAMAVNEPLCAKALALDTLHKDSANKMALEETGQLPKTTNHEWYERRGYRLIHKQHNHYWDAHGEAPDMWTVFLRRDIT